MNKFNALKYWGELAIKLTEENIKLKHQLTMISIEEKMKILGNKPDKLIEDVLGGGDE